MTEDLRPPCWPIIKVIPLNKVTVHGLSAWSGLSGKLLLRMARIVGDDVSGKLDIASLLIEHS